MLYIGTCVLVAALTHESRTTDMQDWLARQRPGYIVISDWAMFEFSAALSIEVRTGQLMPAHRAEVHAVFRSTASISLQPPGLRTSTQTGCVPETPCILPLQQIMAFAWYPSITPSPGRDSPSV